MIFRDRNLQNSSWQGDRDGGFEMDEIRVGCHGCYRARCGSAGKGRANAPFPHLDDQATMVGGSETHVGALRKSCMGGKGGSDDGEG